MKKPEFIIFDVSPEIIEGYIERNPEYKPTPIIVKGDPSKPLWQIWMEGYAATGEYSGADLIGLYRADSFDDAVALYVAEDLENKSLYSYRDGKHAIWACRLFDNEMEARKAFG